MSVYHLYGAESSYYTGKARAYLRYKGIPFEEHHATLSVYKNIILPRTGVHYVPIVITPEDEAIQDTTDIIDTLESRFPESSVYPDTPLQKLVALLFELYGDEWLLLPAMHYRWHFKRDNLAFILKEFGGSALPKAPRWCQQFAGVPPALFFGSSVGKIVGVSRRNIPAIETWTETFFEQFNTHLKNHPFLLGSRPSIGDFGLMGPLYAHLYRDPYPGKLMKRIAPRVADWVERMNAPEVNSGHFLPDDQVPNTLWPMLERLFCDQFPVLERTVSRVNEYVVRHPDAEFLPRFLGDMPTSILGIKGTRKTFTYNQWMFQRPLFYYQSLGAEDRARMDPLLKKWGGYDGLQTFIANPLERYQNKLRVKSSG